MMMMGRHLVGVRGMQRWQQEEKMREEKLLFLHVRVKRDGGVKYAVNR